MDAGSTTSLLGLFLALALYADIALADGFLLAREGPRPRPGLTTALGILRMLTIVAATSTLITFIAPVDSLPLLVGSITALMAFLGILQPLFRDIGRRRSAAVRPVVTPLLAPFDAFLTFRDRMRRPLDSRGYDDEGEAPGSDDPVNDDIVIPEHEQVELNEQEREMIRAVVDLEDTWAREVMVPRTDLVAVAEGTSLREVAQEMQRTGHSRLPVYRDTIDTITGIVHARDLLGFLVSTEPLPPLRTIMRTVFFVPEFKPLDELLQEFRQRRDKVAIVVDEYGGVAGIVTVEDVVGQIVGMSTSEFAPSEPQIVMTQDKGAIVDARVTLDELNDLFDTDFEGEGFDTVGGLVYSRLGRIPNAGDEVTADGLRMKVLSVSGRRIRKVRVNRIGETSDQPASRAAQ